MAVYQFTPRPKTAPNEPLTYDITDVNTRASAGTLTKVKSKYRLQWNGLRAEFATRMELRRHLGLLGHKTEGLA